MKSNNISKTELKMQNIIVVTLPLPLHNKAGEIILSKFIKIFEHISDEIFVITGNFPDNIDCTKKFNVKSIKHDTRKNSLLIKIIKYMLVQVKLSWHLLKTSKNNVVFIIGSALTLPLLSAKLAGNKTVLIAIGSQSKSSERLFGGFIFSRIIRILEKINYLLSDKIVLESNNSVSFCSLNKYKYKISMGGLYVDSLLFNNTKKIKDRDELVGYIGRYSEEKGIVNFIEAIPIILNVLNRSKVLICGGGPLLSNVEEIVKQYERVTLIDWIPNEDLADTLNNIKLLVLPSYTEGVPNIVLEAMACGTPVLATSVGGVPDLIIDGKTGFIMKNNSPECIAENVVRALEHPDLEQIVENALVLVNKEFSYESAVERYRVIVEDI